LSLIPDKLSPNHKGRDQDFTRKRKLPFRKLIVFILSITVSGKSKGVDSKSGEFFRNARRSGLWPDAESVHRACISRARNKVPWEVFEEIFYDSVEMAYQLWPEGTPCSNPHCLQCDPYRWNNMSVFAFDGAWYTLPATDEIREEFDPKIGFEYKCQGHCPQCLVSTSYDVFRRLPVARTAVAASTGQEVHAAQPQFKMLS
jgi:hypothetical protein